MERSERPAIGRYQWLKAWTWLTPGLRIVIRRMGVVCHSSEK